MIWLTSDTHYSHGNIIKYANRPFSDAHEMNKALINNWNAAVQPNDTVWILGDVAFCNLKSLKEILRRLNGEINIVLGNHDKVINRNKDELLKEGLVKSIQHYAEITYEGQLFVLFHYPMKTWNKKHYGSIHCFGHVHNKIPAYDRALDVGVDSTVLTSEYRPYSVKEIAKWAEKRPFKFDKNEMKD